MPNARYQISVVIIAGFLAGCVEVQFEPVSPSWEIQVSAGLANTSHSIRDLVGDLALLPPEVLDTLDLTTLSIRFTDTVVMGDTSGDGVSDTGLSPEFFESVRGAEIFVEAENGTPVEMALSIEILDAHQSVLLRIPAQTGALTVQAAPVDETGKVGTPTTVGTSVQLLDDPEQVFERSETLTYTIDLSFPPGVTVGHALSSDSMTIRAWGTFLSTVDP